MENLNENEEGGRPPAVVPAGPGADDKNVEAERDRLLQVLLRAVEEKKEEIFAVRQIEEQELPEPAPQIPEPKSRRKRRRKPEHPSRAPMGDGLCAILESATCVRPTPPSRASSPEMEWPKKVEKKKKKEEKKYNVQNFAWSLGREEEERDSGKQLRRRPRRRPQDLENVFDASVDYDVAWFVVGDCVAEEKGFTMHAHT